MTEASLYIIIPVHNRSHFTRDCLASLQNQTAKDFHVIVVDDGSTDGTTDMIRSEFPEVILLHGDGNLWWTGATNLGVEWALAHQASLIMTLNNDTIASKDFIEWMLYWAGRDPQALLGAFAFDAETKKPVYGGEIIDWKTGGYISLLKGANPEKQHGLERVTHFPGRGLLIPAEVFIKIGLYDAKHFPHYAADDDFTHRATRAGYPVYCNYDARLLIYPNASGSVEITKKKNLRNYINHLFGIKGAANLKVFTLYAVRNCPSRYLPWFLMRGYFQRILGYWFHWLIDPFRPVALWHRSDIGFSDTENGARKHR